MQDVHVAESRSPSVTARDFQIVANSPEQAASVFATRFPDGIVVGDAHELFFANNGGSGSHGILGSTIDMQCTGAGES